MNIGVKFVFYVASLATFIILAESVDVPNEGELTNLLKVEDHNIRTKRAFAQYLQKSLVENENDLLGMKSQLRNKKNIGRRPHGNGFGNKKKPFEDDYPLKIEIPTCLKEGIVLIDGNANYYLKCMKNPKTGGFFQTIFVCVSTSLHAALGMSSCVPKVDCAKCPAD